MKTKTLKIKKIKILGNETQIKEEVKVSGEFKLLACRNCGRQVKVDRNAISSICYLCVHQSSIKN